MGVNSGVNEGCSRLASASRLQISEILAEILVLAEIWVATMRMLAYGVRVAMRFGRLSVPVCHLAQYGGQGPSFLRVAIELLELHR